MSAKYADGTATAATPAGKGAGAPSNGVGARVRVMLGGMR